MAWYGSGPRPDPGIGKNLGYAIQWFAMALAVLIIYLVLSVKRERVQKKEIRKQNRRILILLLVVMVAPIIASYALYFWNVRPVQR